MALLIAGQILIGLYLIIFGFTYAWAIFKAPIDRTYLEVIAGVFGTLVGSVAAQSLIYYHYGYIPWWGILWGPGSFIITGGFQIVFQEYKFRTQVEEAGEARNNRGDNAKTNVS